MLRCAVCDSTEQNSTHEHQIQKWYHYKYKTIIEIMCDKCFEEIREITDEFNLQDVEKELD